MHATYGRDQATIHVLAVASAGGHLIQLRRMSPAWDGCRVSWMTTKAGFRADVEAEAAARGQAAPGFYTVLDANRWQKVRLLRSLMQIAWVILRLRPDVIITTGAAPGFFALRIGKLIGARTIWVDSIANAEELSLSGRKAGRHADLFLTQWEHLARSDDEPEGPHFRGAVL